MKSQKGQDLVEFALVFPVFILIICGIIYVGFFFSDYLTLNNLARSAARDASVIEEITKKSDGQEQNNYEDIADKYGSMIYDAQHNDSDTPNTKTIVTSLYLYRKGSMTVKGPGEHLFKNGPDDSVEVVIPMYLNTNASFVKLLSRFGILSKKPYNIIYYMYDETYQKSGS